MSKNVEAGGNFGERASRFLRNINAIGAVAFAGAGLVVPEASTAMFALAGINAVQALFFEVTRRMAAKRGQPKLKPA